MKKYTMLDYIEEASKTALKNIDNHQNLVKPLLDILNEKDFNSIWLIASGSSYNACTAARAYMKKTLNKEVKVITPYTFTYYENNISDKDVVLVVTQSGLSTNAIEAIKKINELNQTSICLTGNVNSDVKEYADVVIDYGVGEELVGYVTKGVTCLCLYLMLVSLTYAKKENDLDELKKAINLNESMIMQTMNFIEENYKNLCSMNWAYSIGAGANYGTALESALKMGETIHIPSVAYEIEEYIHGPNLQLTPQYNVFIYDGNDLASNRVKQIYLATKEVSDRVYMLTSNKEFIHDKNVIVIDDSLMSEMLPLAYFPFVQLISYIVSRDINSIKQHPLMKKFKSIAMAKTESFVNYDEDD